MLERAALDCFHLVSRCFLCDRWSHIIELVEAGLGRAAALQLCEYLLFPSSARSSTLAIEGPESKLKDIMLKCAASDLATNC
jgi:hypothetical protein